jgi:phage protein D
MIPDFRITVGGQDATGALRDRLLSLSVTDNDGTTADQVTLDLDDRDGRVETPEMEATLEVALGWRGGPLSVMGVFAVDGVGGAGPHQSMRITATAADMKKDVRSPKTRAWVGKSLRDIVATIAAEAGLKPVVGQSVAGAAWEYLAQTAESDLNFLTRIAATLDATAKPAGGALIVQKRGEGKTAAGDVLTPPVITRARMVAWKWNLEGREVYKAVECEWSDTATGAIRKVTRGSGTPLRRLRHVFSTEAEAVRAADAALTGAERAAMSISVRLAGFEPGLLAGAAVQIAGLRPELSGEWHLKTVKHHLDQGGLTTEFEAQKGQA